MRIPLALACAFSGLASRSPGEAFGLTHRMLPAEGEPTRAVALGNMASGVDRGG